MKNLHFIFIAIAAFSCIQLPAFYSLPGIVTFRGSEWVGSEDLYNLSSDLGVFVELVQAPGINTGLNEFTILSKITPVLKTAGIVPRIIYTQPPISEPNAGGQPLAMNDLIAAVSSSSITPSQPITPRGAAVPPKPKAPVQPPKKKVPDAQLILQPPLPALQILVMVQSIEMGYVVYCAGQLLEGVQISRIYLKSDIIYQAITWQKQELLLVSKEQLVNEVDKTIHSIVLAFADRYKSDAERGAKQKQ
jgi:hypothetical protein